MEIVLAGGSGLIGTALRDSLRRDGHRVKTLVRQATSSVDQDSWDPGQGRVDPDFLAGADAVVCLSGVGAGDHRWTDDYKAQMLASRVDTVGTLARSLAEYGGPRVLIAASAVGYYGDGGDRQLTEDTPHGDTFLSQLCVQWEAAADPARAAGVRVAHLRTGLVLSARGGFLKRLTPIVRLGVAGRLGSGRQYLPWITLADEIAAIGHLLEHEVSGPVNVVGPAPARNADFMRALGRLLHRPAVLPTPAFALRVALGEFAEDVLTGQRALPAVLTETGFGFRHTELDSALQWALADS